MFNFNESAPDDVSSGQPLTPRFSTGLTLPLDCVSHNRAHELACLASHSLSNCIGLT